jgi:hypothetical protein
MKPGVNGFNSLDEFATSVGSQALCRIARLMHRAPSLSVLLIDTNTTVVSILQPFASLHPLQQRTYSTAQHAAWQDILLDCVFGKEGLHPRPLDNIARLWPGL